MKINYQFIIIIAFLFLTGCISSTSDEDAVKIINHHHASLSGISAEAVNIAREKLHIAYGHTSHGSQIITGMNDLISFRGNLYQFSNGGDADSLDLRDTPFSGASDLGNPNRTAWAQSTENYLNDNPDINVVIWSWCGQVSSSSEADISTYLSLMNQLERDYPAVVFVYMTGHLDGTGENGILNIRNNQIRQYCIDNDKYLYDFADIESYDPDGNTNYMKLLSDDVCYYDSSGNGSTASYETNPPADPEDLNWAEVWQDAHTEGVDWYSCSAAHSRPLNGNLKAYAAWSLFCLIAENM